MTFYKVINRFIAHQGQAVLFEHNLAVFAAIVESRSHVIQIVNVDSCADRLCQSDPIGSLANALVLLLSPGFWHAENTD